MALAEQPPSASFLQIRMFGPFAARVAGQPLGHLRSRKGQWLLCLLALRPGREMDREWLAGTLWPESSQRQALANLRLSLADLRRALGPEASRLHAPSPRADLVYRTGTGDQADTGPSSAGRIGDAPGDADRSGGRERLEEMLRQGHDRVSVGRARALLGAGILAWNQDDYRRARPLLEESRTLWRRLDDPAGYADAVLVLGCVLVTLGEYAAGESLLNQCREYYRRAGAHREVVFSLAYLARSAFEQEDYARARTLAEDCLTLSRRIEHQWGSAFALMILGSIAGKEGDYDRAVALCQDSLALSRELGNRRGEARCRLVLGLIACRQGQLPEAGRRFQECLSVFEDLGDREGICYTLFSRSRRKKLPRAANPCVSQNAGFL